VSIEVLSLDQVRDGIVVEHNSASSWADVLRQLDAPAFRAWPVRRPSTVSEGAAERGVAPHQAKATALQLLHTLSRGEYAGVHDSSSLNDLADRFLELRRAFPDLQLIPVMQIAEGTLVATRVTLRGTHLGSLYGFPATGRSVSWDFFCLARITRDAVVEQQSLFDWNAALAQLDLLAM
jgi:predicted ester cyclase